MVPQREGLADLITPPRTRYARSGDVSIAHQVIGDGPIDVVLVPGYISHVELIWEIPTAVHIIERIASFARLIVFDKRGSGLSDPVVGAPPDRATGGPAKRKAAAKKAANTRKRNAAKRSASAKKGAKTRAKAKA